MSVQEKQLIDLLFSVQRFETRCKKLPSVIAVPPIVYKRLDQLRAELSKWGIECVVQERETNDGQS